MTTSNSLPFTIGVRTATNTALEQACAALGVGYSIRFSDIPAGIFRVTGENGEYAMWGSSAVYDPIRREVRFVGKMNSDFPSHWLIYYEDTDTWTTDDRPLFPQRSPNNGHGYDHNACDPATGDHFFKDGAELQIWKWNGAWEQLPALDNSPWIATTLTFVPGLGLFHMRSGANGIIEYYNGTQWVEIDRGFGAALNHPVSEYNAASHTVVFGNGGPNPDPTVNPMYALNCTDLTVSSVATAPANFGAGSGQGILVSDPNSTEFIATLKSGTAWWRYDVANDAGGWPSLTQSTGNGDTQQLGLPNLNPAFDYRRLAVTLQEYGCIMFIQSNPTDNSGEAWLYRHS